MPLSPFHAMVDRESRDRQSLLYQVYFPTHKLCHGKTPYIAGPDLGRTDQGWRGPPYRYRFWALKVLYG
jgi:hypothetical protein